MPVVGLRCRDRANEPANDTRAKPAKQRSTTATWATSAQVRKAANRTRSLIVARSPAAHAAVSLAHADRSGTQADRRRAREQPRAFGRHLGRPVGLARHLAVVKAIQDGPPRRCAGVAIRDPHPTV